MEITSPEAMAKLADDVRQQEEPFRKAAVEAFESLFTSEYKRLRAAAIESGASTATLKVTVTCNFDPEKRSVNIESAPAVVEPRPRRQAVRVGK